MCDAAVQQPRGALALLESRLLLDLRGSTWRGARAVMGALAKRLLR